ncbi:hydrophobin 2 [Lentinula raphanica]|uniref:Hydrophobin n=1 Tax=Lentinula raphanica TaxID=153919 RepID=A0AA38UMH9_9AGAR|nr:hydrophobin 2 [Lentinula raphanica]
MQFKLAFVSVALAALVAANPTPGGEGSEPATGSCSTGPVQCCQSIVPASDGTAAGILSSLGIVLGDLVDVGLGCTSLTGTCSGQTACCEDNSHGDLISISCVSIL